MGGKTDYGSYSTTQGGVGGVVADPPTPNAHASSGATEPNWPTTLYATVVDGAVESGSGSPSVPYTPVVGAVNSGGDGSWFGGGGGIVEPVGNYGAGSNGITWTAIYARKTQGVVKGVLNPAVFQHDRTVYPHHYFQYGKLKWLTGLNAGVEMDIRDSMGPVTQDGATSKPYIFGLELMPAPIAVGDTFEATVGCPKTRYACQQFNNMDNLRCFPDMPTEERALQTPNITNQGYATPQNQK